MISQSENMLEYCLANKRLLRTPLKKIDVGDNAVQHQNVIIFLCQNLNLIFQSFHNYINN